MSCYFLTIALAALFAAGANPSRADAPARVLRSDNDQRLLQRQPLVRFEVDRDVFRHDEIPRIFLQWLGPPPTAGRPAPLSISLQAPDGRTLASRCTGPSLESGASRSGFDAYVVKNECYDFSAPGVYRLTARPRTRPQQGATLLLRLIAEPPRLPVAGPERAFPAAVLHGDFAHCQNQAAEQRVSARDGQISITALGRSDAQPLPERLQVLGPTLASRIGLKTWSPVTSARAQVAGGWLLGTDAGEFGGDLFAVDDTTLTATRIQTGNRSGSRRQHCGATPDCTAPQNVNGIVPDPADVSDSFVVFQGLFDSGRVTKVSRRRGRWSAHLLADLYRAPAAWQRRRGGWLVVTDTALIELGDGGQLPLGKPFANLNTISFYPNSVVELPDGTIWIGVRGGAVRLTPVWPEAPRFWPEYVVAPAAAIAKAIAAGKPCL